MKYPLMICLLALGAMLASCDRTTGEIAEVPPTAKNTMKDPYRRTGHEAFEIAKALFGQAHATRGGASAPRIEVSGVATPTSLTRGTTDTPHDMPDTMMYVCNAGEDYGFALISGDKRTPELLAYVPQGSYHAGQDVGDNGFRVFLSRIPGFIEREIDRSDAITETDNKTLNFRTRGESEHTDRISCSYYHREDLIIASLLLKTEWGQGNPYNKRAPQQPDGYKALTGCVATAVGQIMAFHGYPERVYGDKINWKLLHDQANFGTNYSTEAAILLRHIGDSLPNKWGMNGTSAKTENAVALLRKLGYSVPKGIVAYNAKDIYASLDASKPVIMRGEEEKYRYENGAFVREPVNGHAWIIDGYATEKGYKVTIYASKRIEKLRADRLLLHCNWGWNALYNGFFESGVFDSTSPITWDHPEMNPYKDRIRSGRKGNKNPNFYDHDLQCIPFISPSPVR